MWINNVVGLGVVARQLKSKYRMTVLGLIVLLPGWLGAIAMSDVGHGATEPPQTKFGIEYFLWHCLTKNVPIRDISEYEAGRESLGAATQFHWWGKPAAGYYCLSDDDALLSRHASELTQAGIDFIFIDFSNHDNLSYQRVNDEYLNPLARLLAVWSKIPKAPKIVPFMQLTRDGDLYREFISRLDHYPDLEFIYLGKPLLLLVQSTGIDPAKRAELDQRFTTRAMWDDFSPEGTWMFISRCQHGFVESKGKIDCKQRVAYHGGKIEQISVSAAFQRDYMSNRATAAPRYGGRTFLKQMARIDDFGFVPIVTILGWNQWIAQRLCVKAATSEPDPFCSPGSRPELNGTPIFTDEYDQEYSSDFEPGGAMGDAYYRLLSCEIHRRKAARSAGGAACKTYE